MPRYYRRPARELEPGMCTDDGQEILHVDVGDDLVIAEVYTPRPDDPALDAHNRATPESRIHRPGDLVHLAVFDPQVPTVDQDERDTALTEPDTEAAMSEIKDLHSDHDLERIEIATRELVVHLDETDTAIRLAEQELDLLTGPSLYDI